MRLAIMIENWNHFWFERKPATPVALYRIAIGLIALTAGILLTPDVLTWYSDNGALRLATSEAMAPTYHISLFPLLPNTDTSIFNIFLLYLGSAFLVTIGLCTRTSAAVLWLCSLSLYHRNPVIIATGDPSLHIAVFFLIFSEAGSALSVDRLIRIAQGKETKELPLKPVWGQRLIQVHLSIMYLSDFYRKWHGINWVNGNALYYMSRVENPWRLHIPYLFTHQWTYRLLTWGSLALQGLLGTAVWVIEARYILLAAGLLFALLIGPTVNLPMFQPVMLASYLTFIEPEHLTLLRKKLGTLFGRRTGGPLC